MLSFGLLENPVPVDARDLSLRIDPRFRYPSIGHTHAIDLAMPEVLRMSTYRPLVFDNPAKGVFCLASLSDHVVQTNPGLHLLETDYIPLALRAFPFGVMPGEDPQHQILIIESMPGPVQDEADSISIFEGPGQLSAKLNPQWEALKALAAGKARVRYLIDALNEANVFEPWSLTLRFEDRDVLVAGCQIIRSIFWDSETYQQLLEVHGPDMATLVHCHRLSLQTVQKSGWARKKEQSGEKPKERSARRVRKRAQR
jgi:hypothetical protein